MRSLLSCSPRATSSLPVPVSPVIKTPTSIGAIFFSNPKIWRIFKERPTISPKRPSLSGSTTMSSSIGENRIDESPTTSDDPGEM